MSEPFVIRPIEAADNAAVQHIIETVMPEFGASGAGFAIHDPEVKAMYQAYQAPGTRYFVVLREGEVQGAGGIAPLSGEADVCELRKMYFLSALRGCGAGSALMQRCLDAARELGYQRIYLETLCGMYAAKRLYERSGFVQISSSMGNTGHFGCDRYYLRAL